MGKAVGAGIEQRECAALVGRRGVRGGVRGLQVDVDEVRDDGDAHRLAGDRDDVLGRVGQQRHHLVGVAVEVALDRRHGEDHGMAARDATDFDDQFRPDVADLEDEGQVLAAGDTQGGEGGEQVEEPVDKVRPADAGQRRALRHPAGEVEHGDEAPDRRLLVAAGRQLEEAHALDAGLLHCVRRLRAAEPPW